MINFFLSASRIDFRGMVEVYVFFKKNLAPLNIFFLYNFIYLHWFYLRFDLVVCLSFFNFFFQFHFSSTFDLVGIKCSGSFFF